MATESAGTDKSVGFAALFAVLGVLGAVGMYFFSVQGSLAASGWSFALALAGAAALIAAVHIYG
jgi:hypothetical protein